METQPTPAANAAPEDALGKSRVELPSRGLLYDDKIPGGRLQMRKLTSLELQKLSQGGGDPIKKINSVVAACTTFPEGFAHADLLTTDAMYLMIALRTLTYGPSYRFQFRCSFCGRVQRTDVDIVQELDVVKLKDDFEEPFSVKLPDCEHTIEQRFLRQRDLDTIISSARRMKMASNDGDDPSYLLRLATQIVTIDGSAPRDILAAQKFVAGLGARDALALERNVSDQEPGIDIRVFPICEGCSAPNELSMPFDAEFFRPH